MQPDGSWILPHPEAIHSRRDRPLLFAAAAPTPSWQPTCFLFVVSMKPSAISELVFRWINQTIIRIWIKSKLSFYSVIR